MTTVRAAIIDLDGTLVDTLGDFVVAINATLAELGLEAVDRSFLERTIGKGSEHLIRATLVHVGADAALYDTAWAAYQRHYLAVNGLHSSVYPGALEGLQRLRAQGIRLACLTNKPTAFARPLLESKRLDDFFAVIYGGDSFERKKPDPLPILKACEALGVAPAHTLMIGDSSNDARAARAAGCPVLLVSYGYNHGEPVDAVASDGVLERLDRIVLSGLR
jgi:phosphoglycolate phosphatase